MTVAALASDPLIAAWADGLGAPFVSGYLVFMALGMLRTGLPDLFDRSVDEATRRSILGVLADHVDAYGRLERMRSRRSGSTIFVEIALAFDPGLHLAEIDRRTAAIRTRMMREIEGAEISILTGPHEPAPAASPS